ncbi:hypothetical protein [Halorhabdus sp. CBA1104]|uniref:hypothetical protein n=1 Tax=Halorhabdus sp. CBA1104 TaxID=1380432 RepID=UPI0012B41DD5|nr:hypothetical protein [Halorhabdus sp. CBA1104]
MSEIVIRGTVSDVIAREEVGRYVLPDAVRHHIHDGEEVAKIIPDGRADHPIRRLESIPVVGWALANIVFTFTPEPWEPAPTPEVIAPAGTFDAADDGTHEIVVELVVDPDVPAADGGVPVYRYVESVPFEVREGIDWPTPSFDRPGVMYPCARCGKYVQPSEGDKEAGLVIAGSTTKLCGECAEAVRDYIETSNPYDVADPEEWPVGISPYHARTLNERQERGEER